MLGEKKEAQEKNFLGEKIAKSKTYLAQNQTTVSYTHILAHETRDDLVWGGGR